MVLSHLYLQAAHLTQPTEHKHPVRLDNLVVNVLYYNNVVLTMMHRASDLNWDIYEKNMFVQIVTEPIRKT